MRLRLVAALLAAAFCIALPVRAENQTSPSFDSSLTRLKQDYEQRILALEKQVETAAREAQEAQSMARQAVDLHPQKPAAHEESPARSAGFNPAISLVLEGRYTDIDETELQLPGFQLGGEAGLPEEGFTTGHNELVMSANVDHLFYAELSAALVRDEGETVIEMEEAYLETLTLNHGLTLKAGQFFSGVGYLNDVHDHAHDFADRPLVYDALLGGHLLDTGMQLRWVAPLDYYLQVGGEVLSGSEYPSGENGSNDGGIGLFVKTGGDLTASSSWQLGASYYDAAFDLRAAGGHHHGEELEEVSNALLDGEVTLYGIDFVYKWAPLGNSRQRHLTLQGEYFLREESGASEFVEGDELAVARYDGEQSGFYVQTVYQFMPSWRVGARYEGLHADNRLRDFVSGEISREEFGEESGLEAEDEPAKYSLMVDFAPSHFSRLRLQYSALEGGHEGADKNEQLVLQYVVTLGAHGAHQY